MGYFFTLSLKLSPILATFFILLERENGGMSEAIFRMFQRASVSEIWPSKFGYREKSCRRTFARFPIKERTLSDLTHSVLRCRSRRLKE